MHLFLPTKVYFGPNVLKELIVKESSVLLIHASHVSENLVNRVTTLLQANDVRVRLLKKEPGEPTSDSIDNLFAAASDRNSGCEAIVGLGGGSTLDTAKALALLLASGGQVADYEFGSRQVEAVLPLYLLPTTCGSGSEVTPYAVITNSQTKRKFTLTHQLLRAQSAYVDPLACQGGSFRHLQSAILDAFVHCLEALLNRQQNLLIQPYALDGMRLIYKHFRAEAGVLGDEGMTALALASLYGGICISHSRTGLIHTLSAAFSQCSGEPHGLLNAKLLPHVLRYNSGSYAGQLADTVSAFTGQYIESDAYAVEYLIDWFSRCTAGQRLSINGDADVNSLVDRVLQDTGLPLVNTRSLSREDLQLLVQEVINAV